MFDQTRGQRRRIAIVGGGISGLSAAYYLSETYDVTLFETMPRLGGHARTVLAGRNGDLPVDTGFIVFNYATYPNLTRLFRDLDVPVIKSEMSFGASIDDGRFEYGLSNLRALIAQRSNLLKPAFYGMIRDVLKFGKFAETAATSDEMTVGELSRKLGLGQWFRDYYLLPMCGAIWSTPVAEVDQFPARSLVRFFRNHALLAGTGQHQWFTVKGGSIEYVKRLQAALEERRVSIRLGSQVRAVKRAGDGVVLKADRRLSESFDHLIFACHSDQALRILGAEATPAEAAALGAIKYQPNRAVLHADPSHMPKRRACWSSWSYRAQEDGIGVTYWMNRLQSIREDDPLFVTLNPAAPIDPARVYDDVTFSHPVFDKAALRAQQEIRDMQGMNNTWFAGAYLRHGFHEDGIASAMRVVRALQDDTPQREINDAFDGQSPQIEIPVDMRRPA